MLEGVRGAIFDLDGTLLDTASLWNKLDAEFLSNHGLVPSPEYLERIDNMSFREAAEYTVSHFSMSESADEILAEWKFMARKEYAKVKLKDGSRDFLLFLKERSVNLAVATDLTREDAENALKANDVFHLFQTVITTEECGRDKHYPDVYLQAAAALSLKISECIVFEDQAMGIESACKAGFRTVQISERNGESPADYIISSFTELLGIRIDI